jgi:hypothetical protein
MDEDELADVMAEQQARAELGEMLQQHNVPQEQPQDGAAAGGDAEMHDADAEQQENVPPPEGGDANVQQPQSQQGKQQQEAGKQQTQQQQASQQRRTTSISAEKYDFIKVGPEPQQHLRKALLLLDLHVAVVRNTCALLLNSWCIQHAEAHDVLQSQPSHSHHIEHALGVSPSSHSLIILCPLPLPFLLLRLLPQNMLLRRLWEIQQEQERQPAAASEAEAAAGMEVDGDAAPAPPSREQRAGVVQKELVEWYMQKQLERCAAWLLWAFDSVISCLGAMCWWRAVHTTLYSVIELCVGLISLCCFLYNGSGSAQRCCHVCQLGPPTKQISCVAAPCGYCVTYRATHHLNAQPCFAAASCRNAIASVQAAEVEFELAYKVINHMYRKEGLVSVVGAPKRQAGEDDDAYRNRLWKERRLALSPNFVPE